MKTYSWISTCILSIFVYNTTSAISPILHSHLPWSEGTGFWPRRVSREPGSLYSNQRWKGCNQHSFTYYLNKCYSFAHFKSRLLLILFVGEEECKICFPQSKGFERRLHSCQYLLMIVFYGYPSPHSFQISYFFSGCHVENMYSYPHIVKTVIYYFLSGFVL